MVGVPRTKRCQRCKRRKIKCDEQWPTCSQCKKAHVQCSGPPAWPKFVHNGNHVMTLHAFDGDERAATVGHLAASAVPNSLFETPVTGTFDQELFLQFRIRQIPSTNSDRVAARLVPHLHGDQSRDVLPNLSYLQFMPHRLHGHEALTVCADLLCSSLSNFHRRLPPGQLLDTRLYGKALRSVQEALGGSQQLSCETLASVTLLNYCETLFNVTRPRWATVHARGIYSLMMKKGPPRLNDDLDLYLTLEIQGTILPLWAMEGKSNFFEAPHWKKALDHAQNKASQTYPGFEAAYELDFYARKWPFMVLELQKIYNSHDQNTIHEKAPDVKQQLNEIERNLRTIGQQLFSQAHKQGKVVLKPDPELPFRARYDFVTFDFCQLFMGILTLRIVFTRMLCDLNLATGDADESLAMEHHTMCHRIGMFIPYMRQAGPLVVTAFLTTFFLSYEEADGAEKKYLLDFIIESDMYKRRLPSDRFELEQYILHTARAKVGYVPLDVSK